MSAYFIISLDTEFYWGNQSHPRSIHHENKVIHIIADLLSLFEKYDVPVTWAVVGKIFISHYKDIIEKIIFSPSRHEIAYHSFNHINFLENNREAVEKEFLEGIKLQNHYGITFNSFVFPGNKIAHINLLKKYGFQIYRGYNLAGKNVNKNLPTRTMNFIISKIQSSPVEPIWKDNIWEIPSSMYFFDSLLPSTIELRTKLGIEKTIEDNKIFHIFTHPEQFLVDKDLINKLEHILSFVSKKRREESQLKIVTMGELASILKSNPDVDTITRDR